MIYAQGANGRVRATERARRINDSKNRQKCEKFLQNPEEKAGGWFSKKKNYDTECGYLKTVAVLDEDVRGACSAIQNDSDAPSKFKEKCEKLTL